MKTNPEFDRFTGFMDKLAKVPHSELKASLDAERAAKAAEPEASQDEEGRKFEKWLKRTAPAHKRKMDRSGMHLRLPSGQNPLVDAVNAVGNRARRRKLN
jgi:hypothetical protein